MLGPGRRKVLDKHATVLDPDLEAALSAIEAGHASCDAVAVATGLSASIAATALARLELLGYLTCSSLGNYSRSLSRSKL